MSLQVETLSDLLHNRAAESPDEPGIRTRQGDTWKDSSWKEIADRADRIAAGIISATELDDNAAVGILGQTSEDWITCDHAALSVGLQTVPIYASLLPEEVGYAHVDTDIRLVIVDDKVQLEKVRKMRGGFSFFEKDYSAEEVNLVHIVVIDPSGIDADKDWESLADLEKRGTEKLEEMRGEMKRRRDGAKPDQIATYTYTSGTTGPPKAVIQTHENHLSMARMVDHANVIDERMKASGLFLFLPLAHSFGRLIQFAGPYNGVPLVISSVPTLVDDLTSARPGFFPGAPRVYEKMKSKIEGKVAGAPPIRQKLFHWAIGAGKATIPYRIKGQPVPGFTNFKYKIADKIVLSKLRAALGFDRAVALLSGSAPLDAEVQSFFLAMGLDLLEGYGLTETCPALTCNQPGKIRVGTVGPALPGVTIKIAADGEILAKGPNVTQGYLNRPEATADAFDDEGWFHTGDLGMVSDEGFVKITGRKKELIKTSGGKYVAPAKIEGQLKLMPIIQEAVVVGDTRNYCIALLAVDPEELGEWAALKGLEANQDLPEVKAAIDAHLTKVNSKLASFESIKYYRLLPEPMSIENGLLTASLKVKRKVVEDRYQDTINDIYDSANK
jgi:long-chain acyl-CoA synthetase